MSLSSFAPLVATASAARRKWLASVRCGACLLEGLAGRVVVLLGGRGLAGPLAAVLLTATYGNRDARSSSRCYYSAA